MRMKLTPFLTVCLLAAPTLVCAADVQVGPCVVQGATRLSEAEIRALAEPYIASGTEPATCKHLGETLQDAMRRAGALLARVYYEPDPQSGDLRLRVIEGRLAAGGISLGRSAARVEDAVILAQLARAMAPGETIMSDQVERAILLTNDLPGIGGSTSKIYPGENVGEARFELFPADGKAFEGQVFADNFGHRDTGRERLGAAVHLNSPFRRGDRLTLGANATSEGTLFAYADASLPLGSQGLRAGLTVDGLSYRTAASASTPLTGTYRHYSAYLAYPLLRSRQANLRTELRFGRDTMNDRTDAAPVADRVVDALTLDLQGDRTDGLWGGGSSQFGLRAVFGRVNLAGYQPYADLDASTAQTAGHFSRLAWRLSRLQQVHGPWQAYLELAGQLASKRLDASQALVFGGPDDLAGYRSGEVLGNQGYRMRADIRYNMRVASLGGKQQVQLFYDQGRLRSHARQIVGGFVVPGIQERRFTMRSAGLGFNQSWADVDLQAVVGWRIRNEVPADLLEGGEAGDGLHGWVRVSYKF